MAQNTHKIYKQIPVTERKPKIDQKVIGIGYDKKETSTVILAENGYWFSFEHECECDEPEFWLEEVSIILPNLNGNFAFRPMDEFPTIVEGESFSETVLVFDEDLESCQMGFYNFDDGRWDYFGCLGMELVCWRYIEKPNEVWRLK